MSQTFLERHITNDKKGRIKAGVIIAVMGLLLNSTLFSLKYTAGIFSGSLAITADSFNNLADSGVCIVTLLGIRLGLMPPDKKYPLGYGRLEYLSGLVISVAIILLGGNLLRSAIDKILYPEPIESSTAILIILFASIAIKSFMFFYNRRIGNMINCAGMKAASKEALCDCISTTTILLSIIIEKLTGFCADGYTGALVSLCILYAGFTSVIDCTHPLLGRGIDKELSDKLYTITKPYKIEKAALHDYGPKRKLLTMYLCSDISAETIADLRKRILKELDMEAIICPCHKHE